MNEITDHLERLFSPYPQTPRLCEARKRLQETMEDAYASLVSEGATPNEAVVEVVARFGSLDDLAPGLGISADIATAGGAPGGQGVGDAATVPVYPLITKEEAEGLAQTYRSTRSRLGVATALFVLSPAPLLLLLAATNAPGLSFAAEAAVGLGLVLLLVIVAIATMMSASISRRFAPFSHLQHQRFTPDPAVVTWINDLSHSNERRLAAALRVGIALWILSPVTLIVVALVPPFPLQGVWIMLSAVLLLVMVAVGLYVYLRETWASSTADVIKRGVEQRRSPARV